MQSSLAEKIPGFKFNLGYSGKGYKRGNNEEDEGDEAILEYGHRFTWFSHLYDHEQPHRYSQNDLEQSMKRNLKFAKVCSTYVNLAVLGMAYSPFHMQTTRRIEQVKLLRSHYDFFSDQDYGICLNTSYGVAPHHSGVYPVHEELYTAWSKVDRITVTSTEEYPHLKPAWLRRGYIYKGVRVMIKQFNCVLSGLVRIHSQ